MEHITITADHLADFRKAADARLRRIAGISKFNYALTKVMHQADSQYKRFETEMNNLRVSYAEVDKDGNLLRSPNGTFVYKPKRMEELNMAMLELSNTFTTEIKPHFVVDEFPTDLTSEELVLYTGLVITEAAANELLTNAPKQEAAVAPAE